MFGKIAYTWNLMQASWGGLKKDKTLLIFPLLSGLCCLGILATFIVPIVPVDVAAGSNGASHHLNVNAIAGYGLLFLFYLATYFVVTFFNTAIVSGAVLRMTGGSPTVGLILRMIENRSKWVGRIVVGLLGMAWTVVSFLVVPVLVVERKARFRR